MTCCYDKNCCCIQSTRCNRATRCSFLATSTISFLAYFLLLTFTVFTVANVKIFFQDRSFSVDENTFDYNTILGTLVFSSIMIILTITSCASMKKNRCGGLPTIYSIFTISLFIIMGFVFLFQLNLVLFNFQFVQFYIQYMLNYLQEICCTTYPGARVCYPVESSCHLARMTNTTFREAVTENLSEEQYFILGGTLVLTLLLLATGISAARLGCMISYSVAVDEEEEDIVQGEVMYVIDAFVDKREGKKGEPIVFAGNSFYNVEAWPKGKL
jgi:hypothetical protein